MSRRVATVGDIMPTLLAAAGLAGVDVPGRSLWHEWFTAQPVFFHKNVTPEQWGLRDGPWKYIAGIRNREAELYDLVRDPDEQVNLAGQNPDRVGALRRALPAAVHPPRRRVHRPLAGLPLPRRAMPSPARKFVLPARSGWRWVSSPTMAPAGSSDATPSTRGRSPLPMCAWSATSGRRRSSSAGAPRPCGEYRRTVGISPEHVWFRLAYPGPRPMEPGNGRCHLRDPADGESLLAAQFRVGPLGTSISSNR